MDEIIYGMGLILAICVAGVVAFIVAKGLWIAVKSIWRNGPEFLGKVFVTLVAGFIAGIVGTSFLDAGFQMSGGVGLAVAGLSFLKG